MMMVTDDDNDDVQVLKNIENCIKQNGIAVIDYMNIHKVIKNLVKSETTVRDHLEFDIKRHVTDGFITKDIHLIDNGKEHNFQERVKAIDLAKFKSYCRLANLKINHIFGDYNLSEFNEETSDRLILILSK